MLICFSEMDSPVEKWICQIGVNPWSLGLMTICEAVERVPTDALVNWKDKAGIKYCIQRFSANRDTLLQPADELYHQAGRAAAI